MNVCNCLSCVGLLCPRDQLRKYDMSVTVIWLKMKPLIRNNQLSLPQSKRCSDSLACYHYYYLYYYYTSKH